jgi:hypothetical protein
LRPAATAAERTAIATERSGIWVRLGLGLGVWMGAGRRLVLRIPPTVAAGTPGGLQALLEADETAIPTAIVAAIIYAPRIILRLRACADTHCRDNNP